MIEKHPFLFFVTVLAVFVTMVYWMYHKVNVDFEKLNSRGVKTIGIVSGNLGTIATIDYVANHQTWEYLKSLKSQNRSIVDALNIGDTLEVTYLPEDPELAYVDLESWWNFRNE